MPREAMDTFLNSLHGADESRNFGRTGYLDPHARRANLPAPEIPVWMRLHD